MRRKALPRLTEMSPCPQSKPLQRLGLVASLINTIKQLIVKINKMSYLHHRVVFHQLQSSDIAVERSIYIIEEVL